MSQSRLLTVTHRRTKTTVGAHSNAAADVRAPEQLGGAASAGREDDREASVASTPVFVDATGRRARRLRFLALVTCLALLLYLGMVASGLLGSSVDLSTAIPQ